MTDHELFLSINEPFAAGLFELEGASPMFRFDRLPENMSTMDARSVRTELSKIRDVANVISADMAKVLDKNRQPVERRDEAR